MVIASLAWSLKAWSALLLPEQGRWKEKHREEKRRLLRMDFSTFRNALDQDPGTDRLARADDSSTGSCPGIPGKRAFFRLLEMLEPAAALLTTTLKPESGCSGPPPRLGP